MLFVLFALNYEFLYLIELYNAMCLFFYNFVLYKGTRNRKTQHSCGDWFCVTEFCDYVPELSKIT